MNESHQREAAIFDGALELPPDQRAAYLERTCANDAGLRQRIEALLKACERTSEFLDGTAPGAAAAHSLVRGGGQGEGAPRVPFEKPGDTIGRYKLLQQIGEGGCGVVYMAEQEEPVRRRVALKVIKLGMDTKSVIARFEAERQALAMMDHPNIAKVLDAGATDTGRPYFVMELVRGVKLTDFCDQNSLSTRERLELFVQVCRAIQHAHQKGIIHRDIKPSNVLVTLHDGVPVPKVIDFGIAKATQGRLTDHTLFTAFEQFLGTPAYTSPEQAEMSGIDIDTRSDIYSLGVLLYELLTGKTPFETKELLAAGLDEMRRTIREKEPARPSTRLSTMVAGDLRTAARHRQTEPPRLIHLIRGDLDWIAMRCLEKDRARRYETANGLAADIQRHLRNEPVVARPPSAAYRFQKMVRRNKLAFAAGCSMAAALVIGLSVATWMFFRERAAFKHAAVSEKKAYAEALKSDQEAQRARRAEAETREQLWHSYLNEARANRWSGRAGRRFDSLEVLKKAAEIRPSRELRNEAIACMALPDLRLARVWELTPRDKVFMVFDSTSERYAKLDAANGLVTIYRTTDEAELMRLPGFNLPYGYASFSPNGRYLWIVCGSEKANLRVWDLNRKELVLQPSGWCRTVSFSEDSSLMVAAFGGMKTVIIYQMPSGKALQAFAQEKLPWSVIFDPVAQKLAVSSDQDENVLIREVATGNLLQSLKHPLPVKCVSWHPSGKALVTACMDRNLYSWNTRTWTIDKTFKGTANACIEVYFDHTGDLLSSGGWDGKLRLWDYSSGRQLVSSVIAAGGRFSSDDQWIIAAPNPHSAALWEVAKGQECRIIQATKPGCIDFSPDHRLLASGHKDGVRLWGQPEFRELAFFGNPECATVAFHPDGRSLFTATKSGLEQWPLAYQKAGDTNIFTLGAPLRFGASMKAEDLTINADGSKIAVVEGRYVHVFDTRTCEEKKLLAQDRAWSVALTPDGNWVAATSFGREDVWVWNLQTGELEHKLPFADTTAIIFSPDGRWLVAGGHEEYRFWDVASWKLKYSLPRPSSTGWTGILSFSGDGEMLAVAHGWDTVRLIDPANGRELALLEASHPSHLSRLRLNSDGSQLAAACSADNLLHVWDLRLVRQQLATMKLDWELPPFSTQAPKQSHVPLIVAGLRATNALPEQPATEAPPSLQPMAAMCPPRGSNCSSNLIDLSSFFNAALTNSWFNPTWRHNDLSALPQGTHRLEGIEFDIRGLVQLHGSSGDLVLKYPPAVTGIPVNQHCHALHFLHATGWEPRDGTRVGEYILRYRDDLELAVPLTYANNIRCWSRAPGAPVALAPGSTVAWRGTNSYLRGHYDVVLYRFRFPNPRPEVPIKSIDFKSTGTKAAPFLIAITAE